jgi:hypothetical protein
VDDALARTGAARGQREYTLPTARAFAHMPTAFDHHEIQEDLKSKTGAVPHCDTASPSLPVTECGKERPVKCEFVRETTHVAAAWGLVSMRQGDLAMVRSHVPFSHFNRVPTLGVPATADDRAFDAIERLYAGGSGKHWILVNEYSRPHDLARKFVTRGYTPDGPWERVVRQGVPAAKSAVMTAHKRSDPISQWVTKLEDRAGWQKACVALGHKHARIV